MYRGYELQDRSCLFCSHLHERAPSLDTQRDLQINRKHPAAQALCEVLDRSKTNGRSHTTLTCKLLEKGWQGTGNSKQACGSPQWFIIQLVSLSHSPFTEGPQTSPSHTERACWRHTSSCELCSPLVHTVTIRAGERSFHREQLLSTSLLLHPNPQHTAGPHPAPAKQVQVMAGVTPIPTQSKSDLCIAQLLSPPQHKQHLTQMSPNWH